MDRFTESLAHDLPFSQSITADFDENYFKRDNKSPK